MSKKHFRRVLVVLFALLVVLPAGTGRAAAAGYDGITAAWEKGDAVYVHVRCTQENARLFYAAFSEDDRFLGAQALPVASGTDKTYLFTAPTGTPREAAAVWTPTTSG